MLACLDVFGAIKGTVNKQSYCIPHSFAQRLKLLLSTNLKPLIKCQTAESRFPKKVIDTFVDSTNAVQVVFQIYSAVFFYIFLSLPRQLPMDLYSLLSQLSWLF